MKTTVQDLINEKAEEKLRKDIEDYFQLIKNHRFYREISKAEIRTNAGETTSLYQFIYDNSAEGAAMIREKFLDQYILDESREFMRKIETIGPIVEST